MISINLRKTIKAYDLKISQKIIYVKEYFYVFFTLKDIIEAQNKPNHWIS